jgi:hypothetical protein
VREKYAGFDDDQLEELISKSIKEKMKAIEQNVDVDEAWERFQQRAKEQEKKKKLFRGRRIYKLMLAACSIFLIVVIYKLDTVTAFKNDIFQYMFVNEEGDRILSEGSNINVNNGIYNDLSFKEAQDLTVFHLKNLQYLPESIKEVPDITVNVIVYPIAQATITFKGEIQDGKSIIFEQENMGTSASRNTYIPENKTVEKQIIGNNEVTFIYGENSAKATWIENAIRYTLITHQISNDDLNKILNNIK